MAAECVAAAGQAPVQPELLNPPVPNAPQASGDKLPYAPDVNYDPPQVPSGPVWDAEFSMKYPMLTATCMKCHTSSESKGGFDLSETIRQAKVNRDAETLNEVALTVLSGKMPPKANLPYDVRSKLAEAIMTLPTE
jgi:hypothetical protein